MEADQDTAAIMNTLFLACLVSFVGIAAAQNAPNVNLQFYGESM